MGISGSVVQSARRMDSQDQLICSAIHDILKQDDIKKSEAAAFLMLHIRDQLTSALRNETKTLPEAYDYFAFLNKIDSSLIKTQTFIAVLGCTGAGKSSLLNALVDEGFLLPTDGMRACTSVVTELSWNPSNDPNSRYLAQIEFISREEWRQDLEAIMKDITDKDGNIGKESTDSEDPVKIAWAKFHAIYPHIDKVALNHLTVEHLLAEVGEVLGTTKHIVHAEVESFYDELVEYVDGGNNDNGDSLEIGPSKPPSQLWPLIKVVRIQLKSSVLSTGAVLVDLPGVHDTNAARAAMATSYIQKCIAFWIVAPIVRAVSNKAAKTLLSDSFKRQLKYDGGLSGISFICTMKDNIAIREAARRFGSNPEISKQLAKENEFRKEKDDCRKRLDGLKGKRNALLKVLKDLDTEQAQAIQLNATTNAGESGSTPKTLSLKRKRHDTNKARKKEARYEGSTQAVSENVKEEPGESSSESTSDIDQSEQPPVGMTEGTVNSKIHHLMAKKQDIQRVLENAETQILRLKKQKAAAQKGEFKAKDNAMRIAIQERDGNAIKHIKEDFAVGLRESDQESPGEGLDSRSDNRDYGALANSLPVFPVSSHACQTIRGVGDSGDPVLGFNSIEDTGIPALQEHCKRVTELRRNHRFRVFLLEGCQIFTSLNLWSSDNSMGIRSTEAQGLEHEFLLATLATLKENLKDIPKSCKARIEREIETWISRQLDEWAPFTVQAAPATAQGWGRLAWQTYRAVAARCGVFSSQGNNGHQNFNADLMNPILRRLTTSCENTFKRRIPEAFDQYANDCIGALDTFLKELQNHTSDVPCDISVLKYQIQNHRNILRTMKIELATALNENQRDANRGFAPPIVASMLDAYVKCSNESGPGMFKRMKSTMEGHVEFTRHTMFNESIDNVKVKLNQLCQRLGDMMQQKIDATYESISRDSMTILGSSIVDPKKSEAERALKAKIRTILQEGDEGFRGIASRSWIPPQASLSERDFPDQME